MKTPVRTRLLSALLSLVMLVSLLPVSVFAAEPASKSAALVTDASTLKAGDQIILSATANDSTFAAGAMSGKFLSSVETKLDALDKKVEIFTLGGSAGAWTLTASDGKKISAVKAKELSNSGKGTDTWTIAIDDNGAATIASTNTACGRILYNVRNPRFLNYTSDTNVSMLLPSIYKLDTAAARESGIVTDLTTLQNGDKVVVFNPANKKALSSVYNGFYNTGVDVELTGGKLTGYTDAELWTVNRTESGTYTFSTADGKKLSMDEKYSSTPLDKANVDWELTPPGHWSRLPPRAATISRTWAAAAIWSGMPRRTTGAPTEPSAATSPCSPSSFIWWQTPRSLTSPASPRIPPLL